MSKWERLDMVQLKNTRMRRRYNIVGMFEKRMRESVGWKILKGRKWLI